MSHDETTSMIFAWVFLFPMGLLAIRVFIIMPCEDFDIKLPELKIVKFLILGVWWLWGIVSFGMLLVGTWRLIITLFRYL